MDTIFVIMRPDGTPFHRDDAMGVLATDSEAQAIRFQHAREDEGAEYVRYTRTHPSSAASVSERARALLAAEYRTHGWHEDAGRLCMGGDPTSFVEDDALRVIARLIEEGDEDTHVITEMGRLLAAIAITLKGPEPAGTAGSYHDLPSLVASEVAEPRQVAAEMKAWAHTKMAEQQSSRRDRMMVSEWAKRLLPESSFPIKDFDVEGMSITKEAAREAVKRVALEQALTQQRGAVLDRPARVGGRDFKAGELVQRVVGRAHAEYDRHHGGCLRHPYTGELRDYRDVESDPDGTLCVGPGPLAATTPHPSADAVRELVKRWMIESNWRSGGVGATYKRCADELESLLSAASNHQQNAAQGGGD